MKLKRFALAAAVSAAFGAAATAGTLDPALEQAMSNAGGEGDFPVIVQFSELVDVEALTLEASQLAQDAYPDDPKKQDKERVKLLRKMLVDALKEQSKDTEKQVKDFLKAYGEQNRKLSLLWARNGVTGDIPGYLMDELAVQPGVEEVKLNATVQGPGPDTAPTEPTYWNLGATGVDVLWDLGYTGSGVVVATLDTGVDMSHPDLGPRWRGGGNSWFDPSGQHGSPADLSGHGTRAMGLILAGAAGGYQIGMAPGAQWIAAKIFDDSSQSTLGRIHEAYQWLLDPDGSSSTDDLPDIVNNSWDLTGTEDQCNLEFAGDLELLRAVEVAVVFAGGNYGPKNSTSVSPANGPWVLAVGGVDRNLKIDVQSSRGPGACDGGIFPHVVAPGDKVLTTDLMPSFYNVVSGTSFAVAHVAGGMAVLKGAFPEASATQLATALTSTAVDLGSTGPDDTFGNGLIDMPAAYDWLVADMGGGAPGSLELGASDYSVDENVASVTVTVLRSGGSSGEVSVDYATSDLTATAGEDYEAASGTLTLLDGEVSASFDIAILDDSLVEDDEALTVSLSNAVGATLGGIADASVTILDDDAPDSDGDGVSDALDLCPGTPAGEPVDADGCAPSQLDSDGDGVSDALDLCPGTPAGEAVDADGCAASQLDSDGDGVSDALDLCPNTPAGEPVDANGCPIAGGVTIEITSATYEAKRDKLEVIATSALGSEAALEVVGYGPMKWERNKDRWTYSGQHVGGNPGTVTVRGVEGDVSAPVQ